MDFKEEISYRPPARSNSVRCFIGEQKYPARKLYISRRVMLLQMTICRKWHKKEPPSYEDEGSAYVDKAGDAPGEGALLSQPYPTARAAAFVADSLPSCLPGRGPDVLGFSSRKG